MKIRLLIAAGNTTTGDSFEVRDPKEVLDFVFFIANLGHCSGVFPVESTDVL